MTLHTYSSTAAFLADVQDALETNEILNSLMLGVALRAARPPYTTTPYCAAVYSGRSIVAAALMTPPFSIQIAGEGADSREALELIARSIAESGRTVPGVVARSSVASAFAELCASLYGVSVEKTQRMRLYQLDAVIPPRRPSGVFRMATEADLDLLTAWSEAFAHEATPNDPPRDMRALTAHKIEAKELFLWENGQPVSMAARARPTRNTSTVNNVYTPPEYRGHGYASACTAALSQHQLDSGYKFCLLFTNLENPISNSIYRRIGYRPVCDFTAHYFNPGISQ